MTSPARLLTAADIAIACRLGVAVLRVQREVEAAGVKGDEALALALGAHLDEIAQLGARLANAHTTGEQRGTLALAPWGELPLADLAAKLTDLARELMLTNIPALLAIPGELMRIAEEARASIKDLKPPA